MATMLKWKLVLSPFLHAVASGVRCCHDCRMEFFTMMGHVHILEIKQMFRHILVAVLF